MVCCFGNIMDTLSVTQKRDAIRMFVKDVIWDGKMAHAILFGSNYTYELPDASIAVQSDVDAAIEESNNAVLPPPKRRH